MDFGLPQEHAAFLAAARTFAQTEVAPRAAEIDLSAEYPRSLVARAAALGLAGVTIAPEFGGGGRDYVTYASAVESIAFASATLAVILTVTNSLVAEPIEQFGSDDQKRRWLPKLCSGAAIGAFALSEEQAGSDAKNQRTTATITADGYRLRGQKVWVANAEAANLAIVFARVMDGAADRGITAFLVALPAKGVRAEPSDSLGVRGLGCMHLTFDDVAIGKDARLGGVGEGFHIAMRALEGGRVAIAAQSLGVGQAALDEALAYARQREAFGQKIGNFQAIQFQLADLATDLEAARMLTWKAADMRDRTPSAAVPAAMAKLEASEAAHRAADRAMQILASAGYRRGSTVERLFRDVRAAEIYQGTSEVQRMIIAKNLDRVS